MGVKECKYHILGQSEHTFLTKDAVALPLVTAQPKKSVLRLQRDAGLWHCQEGPCLEN